MASDTNFKQFWQEACDRYKKTTGRDLLLNKEIEQKLLKLQNVNDLKDQIGKRANGFEDFRQKHGKLARTVLTCFQPIETLGGIITSALGLTPYAPACAIFGAALYLIDVGTTGLKEFEMVLRANRRQKLKAPPTTG